MRINFMLVITAPLLRGTFHFSHLEKSDYLPKKTLKASHSFI